MHGSTWWYNGANRPAASHSADQCDMCYDGATLAPFRNAQEATDALAWAVSIYSDSFWFGYSMEPGGCQARGERSRGLGTAIWWQLVALAVCLEVVLLLRQPRCKRGQTPRRQTCTPERSHCCSQRPRGAGVLS
jgi:hypothetical protein